jgi:hypothetical protein
MKPPGSEMPQVVVKWYAYAKWVLERVESFPKSQRFILGQRLRLRLRDSGIKEKPACTDAKRVLIAVGFPTEFSSASYSFSRAKR